MMKSNQRWPALVTLVASLGLVGCSVGSVGFITIEVANSDRSARSATVLRAGPARDDLRHELDISGREFPVSLALAGEPGASGTLFVEAFREVDSVGLGTVDVQFEADRIQVARVDLRRPCDSDASCLDGRFCNGEERCEGGLCVSGSAPCSGAALGPGALEGAPVCALVDCIEGETADVGGCSVVPLPGIDDGNACTRDLCGELGVTHSVDPVLEGTSCVDPEGIVGECRDGACLALCGAQRLSDGISCTLDICGPSGPEHPIDPTSGGRLCDAVGASFHWGVCTDGRCGEQERIVIARLFEGATADRSRPVLAGGGERLTFLVGERLLDTNREAPDDLFMLDRTDGSTVVLLRGRDGTNGAEEHTLSADGKVVGVSTALSLFPYDLPGQLDVYALSPDSNAVELVSLSREGWSGNADSGEPSLSADGRYVAFSSWASDLVDGDIPGTRDVFLRDRSDATTSWVSRRESPEEHGASWAPSVSGDGRYLVFVSSVPSLTGVGLSGATEIILFDRAANLLTRVSGPPAGSSSYADSPKISHNGDRVLFDAWSSLLPEDDNQYRDVYAWERASGQLSLVTRGASGSADGGSVLVAISQEGEAALVRTSARNLEGSARVPSGFQLVAATPAGAGFPAITPQLGVATHVAMSADGRFVAIEYRSDGVWGRRFDIEWLRNRSIP